MKVLGALLVGVVLGWISHDFWQWSQPANIPASPQLGNEPTATSPETGAPKTTADTFAQVVGTGTSHLGSPEATGTEPTQNFDQLVTRCRTIGDEPPALSCSDAVIELAEGIHSASGGFSDTLENWLIEYPSDTRVGLALAQTALDQQNHLYALEILSRLEVYLPRTPGDQSVPQAIRKLVGTVLASDTMRADADARAHWLGSLVERFPTEKIWRFELADTLAETGDYQRAMNMLDFLLYDPDFGERAERLRRSVVEKLELSDHESVPLERIGDQFLATVSVNAQHDMRLLVDTGASITALTSDAIDRMGIIDVVGQVQLETANGVAISQVYRLNSLAAGRQVIRELNVVNLGTNIRVADGLLGMNYLSRFHFTIDQQGNRLYLRPR